MASFALTPRIAGLVMAEVACAFVLLIGCGLMVRSFLALQRIDPGFDAKGVFTFFLPRPAGQTADEQLARTRALRDQIAAIPGVTDATAASALPLDGTSFTGPYGPEAAAADTALMRQAEHRFIVPGYFAAMRTPLLEGREFTDSDNRPGADVVIVDSVLAQRLFPGRPAVGQRILVPRIMGQAQPRPFEVIGVAREQRSAALAHAGRETVFIANGRGGAHMVRRWAVRTSGEVAAIVASVRATVTAADPTMALGDELSLADYVAAAEAPTEFTLSLMLAFAVIAIVLAVVGLYGVLATLVAERTAEIGVRMALGSDRAGVFRLVLTQGLRMSGVGLAIGLGLSLLLTRAMSAMLVGVTATDLGTYLAVGAGFVCVVLAACAIPAWRAATLNPIDALRQDA